MCSIVREAGVEPTLKKIGEFTLFVPSDEAISLLPGSMMVELESDPTKKAEFVLSHVVPGKVFLRSLRPFEEIAANSAQETPIKITAYADGVSEMVIENHIVPGSFYTLVLPGNKARTLGGDLLNFERKNLQSRELVLVNSVPIVNPDQVVTNGVIHGISRLLLPKHLDDCKCERSTTETTTVSTLNPSYYNSANDRSTLPPSLRDASSDTVATDSTPANPFFRRAPSIDNTDGPFRNPKRPSNTLADPPYVIDFTASTTSTVSDELFTSNPPNNQTVTPTPLFFREPRRRPPKRNRTVSTQQLGDDPKSNESDFPPPFTNLRPNSETPSNTHSTAFNEPMSDTFNSNTPFDPTRRPTDKSQYENDNTPNLSTVSYPTYRPQTWVPRSYPRPAPYKPPTTNNDQSTTLSPFFRKPVPTQNPESSMSTTERSSYETPLQPQPPYEFNNPRRRGQVYGSNTVTDRNTPTTTTRLPFWATNTNTEDTRSNTNFKRTTRIINDETEPSTMFFDSTRRPTTQAFAGSRRRTQVEPNYTRLSPEEENLPYQPLRPTTSRPRMRPSPYNPTSRSNRDDILQPDPQTIDEIIDEPGLELNGKPVSFKTFKENMRRAGLSNLMGSTGPFTVFLPTDEAFQTLPPGTLNRLQKSPNLLRNVLLKHITNVEIPPMALRNNFLIQTFSGDTVNVTVDANGKRVLVMGIPIMAATSARNGIIYVIGTVLYKPNLDEESEKLTDELGKRPELSRFNSLLKKTKFERILKSGGPFTVLAPDNSAFDELNPNIEREIIKNPSICEKLIGSHIVTGRYPSQQLVKVSFLTPIIGQKNGLHFSILPGAIIINNVASVMRSDIPAGNGILHIINKVIIPSDLFTNPATSPPPFSTTTEDDSREPIIPQESFPEIEINNAEKDYKFLRILKKAQSLDQLYNSGKKFTLIVPSDEAMKKLPEKITTVMETNPHQLKPLLSYHIIPQSIDFTLIENEEKLPSIDGKPIRFNRYLNNTAIAFSGAIVEKVRSNKNIIFIFVDRVLYPPQGSIEDIVDRSPILKTLSKLMKVAKVNRELSTPGPFTLFAPNDSAFEKLSPNAIKQLMSSADTSRAFILRHIVQPTIFTSAIPMGKDNTTEVLNATGERLKLQKLPDCVSVDGVTLSYADITATNGVVHVIDHVL
ncbi:uncharacterized protein B4U79_14042 [Dinothrombium tinctorium]|uniref:FAS1 domain-containing protein n=1 Tax=Dinothrombium tinctorium TaxID=1965070 RepID=A0A3S3SF38_9ACAR|nr:uncharacterized protein B4U79_14042 [Dinothrombium tinctorium]